MVPNTGECRVPQMEMIGNFLESRDSGGGWTTVFEVPRYSLDRNQDRAVSLRAIRPLARRHPRFPACPVLTTIRAPSGTR